MHYNYVTHYTIYQYYNHHSQLKNFANTIIQAYY